MASVISEHKELIDADDLFNELPQNVSANARIKLDLYEKNAKDITSCTVSSSEDDTDEESQQIIYSF